jgi:hypothetical protein
MGFNSGFKGLNISYHIGEKTEERIKLQEDEEEGLSSYW